MAPSPFVVFGYGSLIFKPPPHVISQVPGYLKGFVRRFALKSHDHRGTPEVGELVLIARGLSHDDALTLKNPGRVVTIIHKEDWSRMRTSDALPEEDIVWGVAFTIDPAHVAEVREYLDDRETDYMVETLDVYTRENGTERVIIHQVNCFISRPDNPSFVHSEPLDALAVRIWRSVGLSGRNKDYLYQLAESMRALAPASYDAHLFTLENKIRQLDKERGGENVLCY